MAQRTARLVNRTEGMGLLREPELTVVLIRRTGRRPEDYYTWSKKLLTEGTAFITPTVWKGETVARLAFLLKSSLRRAAPTTPPRRPSEVRQRRT
ncbi:hypothetical protein [Streptomyces flavidovirens]|uniref:hypothetical protein n=1 Tax=Streptomyces flavidovirens TaxID=67298 RepID=UPI0036BEE588